MQNLWRGHAASSQFYHKQPILLPFLDLFFFFLLFIVLQCYKQVPESSRLSSLQLHWHLCVNDPSSSPLDYCTLLASSHSHDRNSLNRPASFPWMLHTITCSAHKQAHWTLLRLCTWTRRAKLTSSGLTDSDIYSFQVSAGKSENIHRVLNQDKKIQQLRSCVLGVHPFCVVKHIQAEIPQNVECCLVLKWECY